MRLIIMLIFAVLVMANGCAPIPTKKVFYPEIEGTLLENNIPLKNYTVSFSYCSRKSCFDDQWNVYQSVKTDDEGRFLIEEKRKWSLYRMAVPVTTIAYYSLSITSPSGQTRWYFASDLRTPDWAASKKLECDFSHLRREPVGKVNKLKYQEPGCTVKNQ